MPADRLQDALAALIARAAAPHSTALAVYVPGFDAGVERTQKALRSHPDALVTAIRSDLVPPNIHIDAAAKPSPCSTSASLRPQETGLRGRRRRCRLGHVPYAR